MSESDRPIDGGAVIEPRIVDKHPLAIRWFHWVNFPVLAVMVWSGMLIYWANDVYHITVFGHTFKFFPDWFYGPKLPAWVPSWVPHDGSGADRTLWKLDQRLAEGMSWHFLLMWVFGINGLLYVLFVAFSGQWRELLPNRKSVKESFLVVLHDLHLIKSAPPQGKYNGAQRIAYTSIVVMGLGMLITGLAIYKPAKVGWLTALLGGYDLARIWHFAMTIGFVLFFFIHVGQVIKTGWNNFRAMITGKELVK